MRSPLILTMLLGCTNVITETDPGHPANISSNVETETVYAINDCAIPTEAVEHMVVEKLRGAFSTDGYVRLTRIEVNSLLQLKRVMDEQPERNPHLTPILACIDWSKVKPLDWNSTEIPAVIGASE